jgi:hypothetical protein
LAGGQNVSRKAAGEGPKNPPHPKSAVRHLRASDAHGIVLLATHATRGVTGISEGVHHAVWRTLGASASKTAGEATDQTSGITGLVYQAIRGVTNWVEKGLSATLTKLQPLLESADQAASDSPERAAVLAALNGVLGDHLAASGNPLATPMTLRHQGQALDFSALPASFQPTGKILLAIHGLCMNDLQWSAVYKGAGALQPVNHVEAVAQELGCTPVYLRYNSGLHTSQNGHDLARQLAQLVKAWPVPIQEISVLVHSMGGLLMRSALHSATQNTAHGAEDWPRLVKKIVFLGTPHHGAPLERAGNWVDVILGSTPYSRPFAKLGQLRSAGITDLRYGHVLDADWQGHDRFRKKPDSREPLPLPEGVECFTVAATIAARRGSLADRLVGDGLVPLRSALGQHEVRGHSLAFAKTHQSIVYSTNHMQLLSSPEVTQKLLDWLGS